MNVAGNAMETAPGLEENPAVAGTLFWTASPVPKRTKTTDKTTRENSAFFITPPKIFQFDGNLILYPTISQVLFDF
jgi:hypothetical protein